MLQLQPYNSYQVTSDWTNYYYYKNVFNDQLINDLNSMVYKYYSFSKGIVGSTELGTATNSKESNNRDIAYIELANHSKWLYDLLFPLALEANSRLFHFDIDTVTDPIHYVIYPEDGGHLQWHQDIGAMQVNRRKLAMTVQLSDPSEYEGGQFQIWLGGDYYEELPREKGDVLIFPTFCMHRVTPITKGQRKCLVFWTGGRPFR